MGASVSDLDYRALKEVSLVWWITFCLTSLGWQVCVHRLLEQSCTAGRTQDRREGVICFAMFCWKTLGGYTAYNSLPKYFCTLNIALFPGHCSSDICGICFRIVWGVDLVNLNPIDYLWGCTGQTSQIHEVPPSQLIGLKGSAVNISLPDTTEHLLGVC